MKVILCSSQFCMGKDVLCDHLVKTLNEKAEKPNWHRAALANAVKNVFEHSFGVDRDFIEQWKRSPEMPPGMLQTVRSSLQVIGDGFRKIKEDVWVNIVLRDESKKLCISDGRYINEAKIVKEKNGINILLYRPGYLNNDPNESEAQIRPLLEYCASNISEGPIKIKNDSPEALKYYDFFILNDGSIEELYSKVDNLLVPFIENKLII